MSKKNALVMLTVGAVGGFLAAKYGKQFVSAVKSSIDRQPIEEIVEEIKNSVKQGAEDVKKSVEDICSGIEKSCFEYPNMTGYMDEFADYADEEMVSSKSETVYISVPMSEKKENEVKEEELPPLDVKVSDNPEEVRKAAVETLEEVEKAIAEETKTVESPGLALKAKRAKSKAKKVVDDVAENASIVVDKPAVEDKAE